MTKTYFPFDAGAGASVTEDQWAEMAKLWRGTGINPTLLNKLETFADSSGMQVKVKSGVAWVEGFFFKSSAEETVAIAASDATNPRIDCVIVRLDRANNIVDLAVLTGTPAASPTVPTLTQSSSIWEIKLAEVLVDAAAATIAASKVTDKRGWSYAEGQSSLDGWITVLDAWAYASAQSITVPSGAASIYSVGDKIKLTQTTVKYFYVVAVADTLLTLTGGSDYTVANAAISDISYSKSTSPVGFPDYFTWVPTTRTGYTVGAAPEREKIWFKIVGQTLTIDFDLYVTGTTTAFGFDIPAVAKNEANLNPSAVVGKISDGGSAVNEMGRAWIIYNTAAIGFYDTPTSTTWTASGTRSISGSLSYRMEV